MVPLLPFMTIHSLPVCGHTANGQKLIVGNVVHVPNDIASIVNSLPCTLDEMGTVPIQLKRKKSYKTSVFQEIVHPICVMKALEYLPKNSEMYKQYNISLQTTMWLEISETVMIRTDSLLKDTYNLFLMMSQKTPPVNQIQITQHLKKYHKLS